MNEVVQPFIFPQNELEERWKLRCFIDNVIILDSSNQIFEKLDAKIIKDIFSIENKGTVLTAAAVSNMLYAGGYTKEETGSYAQLKGGINFTAFNALKPESKMLLVHCMQDNNPKTAACKKIMMAERNGQEVMIDKDTNNIQIGGNLDWIRTWLEFFTISKFNAEQLMYHKINWKPDKRVSLVHLHNFYCNVIRYYGKTPVTRKVFKKYLEQLGIQFKKGYVNHISGVVYAEEIWIPITSENQQKSIEVGYATIDYEEGSVYTPYGAQLISNLLNQQVTIYRRLGYDKSQEPTYEEIPAEISRKKSNNKRKIEIWEDASISAEAETENTGNTENVVEFNRPDVQEIKEDEFQEYREESEIQNDSETVETQRTSVNSSAKLGANGTIGTNTAANRTDASEFEDSTTETNYAILKAERTEHKPKAFIDYDPLATDNASAFLNGEIKEDTDNSFDTEIREQDSTYGTNDSNDAADWEDDIDDTDPVKTVLTALRVANKIQPITAESLDYWLNRMQISLAELNITAEELLAML